MECSCLIPVKYSGINVIADSEIVTARPVTVSPDSNHHRRVSNPPPYVGEVIGKPATQIRDESTGGRLQIQLVTAQLARQHAASNLKDTSLPSNGTLAFDGQLVSGNTSLVRGVLFAIKLGLIMFVTSLR